MELQERPSLGQCDLTASVNHKILFLVVKLRTQNASDIYLDEPEENRKKIILLGSSIKDFVSEP